MRLHHRYIAIAALLALVFLPFAVAETVMVPMRDGIRLHTDVYLPEGDGPFPVVLTRTCYGMKVGAAVAERFHALGMAFVLQNTRGRNQSEGKDMVFADDGWGKRQDGADTVAWIHQQPWCNGKVGTWGGSALGMTQNLLAGATQDIDCQCIGVAASNFYRQVGFQGGVWRKALTEGWLKLQKSEYIVDVWQSHPYYDEFWEHHDAEARAKRITAPGVHMGGYWDIFGQGTLNAFMTRQHRGRRGAKGNQKLIIGAWVHGPLKKVGDIEMPDNFNFDMGAYENRFYRYWLLGEDNGIMDEPAVNYYTLGDVTRPDGPGNEWHTADDWPPFRTDETPYFLAFDGALLTERPKVKDAALTFTYDPADPCPTHGGQNLLIPAGPFDQAELAKRPDVFTFATEPLREPLEITGRVHARLYVSSDAPDTDFTAKLVDIYPDGRQLLMLDSIQRVKLRKSYRKPKPLKTGKIAKVDIDLWSISLIFDTGHRIGLHVSSSNYPRFEKNPNSGDDYPTEEILRIAHNTVYVNKKHPSALILPVRRH